MPAGTEKRFLNTHKESPVWLFVLQMSLRNEFRGRLTVFLHSPLASTKKMAGISKKMTKVGQSFVVDLKIHLLFKVELTELVSKICLVLLYTFNYFKIHSKHSRFYVQSL